MGEFTSIGKPLLTKKNTKAHLTFAMKYLDYPQDFWANILWTDETNVTLFGRYVSRSIWRKTNTAFHKKNIIPTVKRGGSVMVCGWFAASGPEWLAIIDGTMNSTLYQKILKENVWPSVCDLKLNRTWVMQQAKTMIPNTPASPPLNGSRKTKLRFWSGQVKVRT